MTRSQSQFSLTPPSSPHTNTIIASHSPQPSQSPQIIATTVTTVGATHQHHNWESQSTSTAIAPNHCYHRRRHTPIPQIYDLQIATHHYRYRTRHQTHAHTPHPHRRLNAAAKRTPSHRLTRFDMSTNCDLHIHRRDINIHPRHKSYISAYRHPPSPSSIGYAEFCLRSTASAVVVSAMTKEVRQRESGVEREGRK
ncbi:Hypothetical predicted protein [Olea europaea subsp. europaea]|uniref:Uncharacterized protein n=1 Tax=Olea europaea subsp. europaea TaxID=158383 RepID=A0A8S0TF30_OLEEU|nr:Hypothetical predicted protein [Olea europaea subsp. europaea]